MILYDMYRPKNQCSINYHVEEILDFGTSEILNV